MNIKPKNNDWALITNGEEMITAVWCEIKKGWDCSTEFVMYPVTHWMPLPELPKNLES